MTQLIVAWWATWVWGVLPIMVAIAWWWNDLRYVTSLVSRSTTSDAKLPPGHMGLPFFGEIFSFLWYFKILRRPDDFINSKRRRYGDGGGGMYRTHLFGYPAIIAWSPAVIKFVLQSDHLFPYSWPNSELVGYKSLSAAQGERHIQLRRFVSAQVNQPSALQRIALLAQPRMVESLRLWAQKGTVTAFDEVRRLTFENIGKLFISMEPGPVLDTMVHCFVGLLKGARAQPINFPGTAYYYALQCRKKLVAIFRKELEKRKENESESRTRNDLMDGLMQVNDEDGNKLSEEEVVDAMIGLVVAGYEPSALASMWAIYYLAKAPMVLKKLRDENMAIGGNKIGEFITSNDVSKMKYTNKVVEETLRMANISAFIFRSGDEEVEYQGYIIPKGWKVLLWIRYAHNDSKYFEDPMCFNPDRWNKPAKPGSFQVFGGGSRSCLGNMLSRTQLAIFIHHLAVGYKWELINPDAKIDYLPHPKPVDGVKISFRKL
ncbi:ent-kaurenoic acid oxidase 2-like [Actinidia eriantha]|uniref:ent-kaurenoic acid oxidase 2-like n=1 Tax=Actinidia eriantha TaxID=165200 RepID=UPI002589A3BC|nr:ent-kaurenoic acid oxidase 2-like [Actinidia eriantha]